MSCHHDDAVYCIRKNNNKKQKIKEIYIYIFVISFPFIADLD